MSLDVRTTKLTRRAVPVLYVDMDGTVRHGFDELGRFVNRASDVVVFPEAVQRMKAWKAAGGRIVAVSNQGGIALGHVSPDDVAAAMMETYRQVDCLFDKIAWCSHFPTAIDPEMARCWCRKPRIGLIVESIYDLSAQYRDEYYPPHLGLFVGDRDEDRLCAEAANVDFQWATDWREGKDPD
jgi:D-glycero-D-manno-heptose 1,7-bisphosphate phosphatase